MIESDLHAANRAAHAVARALVELGEWVRQLSRATQDDRLYLHPDDKRILQERVTRASMDLRERLKEYEELTREEGMRG